MDILRVGKNDSRETKPTLIIMINKKNYDEYKTLQLIYNNIKTKQSRPIGHKSHKSKLHDEVVEGTLDIAVVVDRGAEDVATAKKKKKNATSSPQKRKK